MHGIVANVISGADDNSDVIVVVRFAACDSEISRRGSPSVITARGLTKSAGASAATRDIEISSRGRPPRASSYYTTALALSCFAVVCAAARDKEISRPAVPIHGHRRARMLYYYIVFIIVFLHDHRRPYRAYVVSDYRSSRRCITIYRVDSRRTISYRVSVLRSTNL